jgi:thioredoxin 1
MKKLKLVKYGHEQCGPCRNLKPILEQLQFQYADSLEFVDMDTFTMSAEELKAANLRAVPAMVLYKDGVVVWQHVGFLDKASLETVIDQFLVDS